MCEMSEEPHNLSERQCFKAANIASCPCQFVVPLFSVCDVRYMTLEETHYCHTAVPQLRTGHTCRLRDIRLGLGAPMKRNTLFDKCWNTCSQ